MSRLVFSVVAIVFCLLCPVTVAHAGKYLTGNYYNGYQEDGYTYKNGLFYRGDKPFTREYYTYTKQVPYTAYSSYGGYGYGGGYSVPYTAYRAQVYYDWRYVPVEVPYTPPAAAPTYGAGWQQKLLEIASNRDKVEGALRTAALDHSTYLSALKALGLEFHWNGYGTAPAYPAAPYVPAYAAGTGTYSQTNTNTYGAQGSTVYGYSVGNLKDLYGEANLGTLFQQAARLTQNAQTLAGQGHTDFADLVAREGSNRARVAEVLARAQAAVVALQAAGGPPTQEVQSRTFSFRLDQTAGGDVQLVPVDPQQPAAAPQQPGAAQPGAYPPPMPRATGGASPAGKCINCHGGAEAKGGFKVGDYVSLSPATKQAVWARILAPDSDPKHMPPAGQPALTAEEKRWFLTH